VSNCGLINLTGVIAPSTRNSPGDLETAERGEGQACGFGFAQVLGSALGAECGTGVDGGTSQRPDQPSGTQPSVTSETCSASPSVTASTRAGICTAQLPPTEVLGGAPGSGQPSVPSAGPATRGASRLNTAWAGDGPWLPTDLSGAVRDCSVTGVEVPVVKVAASPTGLGRDVIESPVPVDALGDVTRSEEQAEVLSALESVGEVGGLHIVRDRVDPGFPAVTPSGRATDGIAGLSAARAVPEALPASEVDESLAVVAFGVGRVPVEAGDGPTAGARYDVSAWPQIASLGPREVGRMAAGIAVPTGVESAERVSDAAAEHPATGVHASGDEVQRPVSMRLPDALSEKGDWNVRGLLTGESVSVEAEHAGSLMLSESRQAGTALGRSVSDAVSATGPVKPEGSPAIESGASGLPEDNGPAAAVPETRPSGPDLKLAGNVESAVSGITTSEAGFSHSGKPIDISPAAELPVAEPPGVATAPAPGGPHNERLPLAPVEDLLEDYRRSSKKTVSRLDQTWAEDHSTGQATAAHTSKATAWHRATAEDLFSKMLEYANVARAKAGNQARFEIRTADGGRIQVKMCVDSNVVTARIDVSSAQVRDILASHAAELNQRLEMEGLVPEDIAFCLLGDNRGGSQGHGDHRPRGRRTITESAGGVDEAVLFDARTYAFEEWA
jgi:hypothetical protein